MTRILIPALLALTSAAAFASPHSDHGKGERFDRWDANSDGVVTQEELQAADAEKSARLFEKLDTNKDGQLTKEELKARHEEHRAAMREKFEQSFKAADKNADGSLSKDEAQAGMPRLTDRFDEIDTNKDGLVSQDELRAGHRGHHGKKKGGAEPSGR